VVVAFLDAYLKDKKDEVARMEKIGNVPSRPSSQFRSSIAA
jgi:hypothetical protein